MYQYPGTPMTQPPIQGAMPGQMYPPMTGGVPQSQNFDPRGLSTSLQGAGRVNYPPQTQNGLRVLPVASYDEAKAVPTDFMGNTLVMTDLSHGYIYTKIFDPNTGSSIFHAYQRIPEQMAPQPEQQPPTQPQYDARADIEALRNELNGIKHELGLDKEGNV